MKIDTRNSTDEHKGGENCLCLFWRYLENKWCKTIAPNERLVEHLVCSHISRLSSSSKQIVEFVLEATSLRLRFWVLLVEIAQAKQKEKLNGYKMFTYWISNEKEP